MISTELKQRLEILAKNTPALICHISIKKQLRLVKKQKYCDNETRQRKKSSRYGQRKIF